jgi:hypothetical protein
VGGGVAGDDEDAGADDAGDAEQGEAEGAERARVEAGAVVFRGREDRVEVFAILAGGAHARLILPRRPARLGSGP